jgi:hypothetical protein
LSPIDRESSFDPTSHPEPAKDPALWLNAGSFVVPPQDDTKK